MLRSILAAYDDLHNPESSERLVKLIRRKKEEEITKTKNEEQSLPSHEEQTRSNSLLDFVKKEAGRRRFAKKSDFIYSKLDHEQKTTEFITEVRQRLYILHEYNCHVAKATSKYPRTREFDLLLIKYVQLEFDVLYNSPRLSRQLEITTEVRVLRLLQVMLYPAIHNNESLINPHTDSVLKRTVLQLLKEVGSKYLVQNKLVYNIANKIVQRNYASSTPFSGRDSRVFEIHKNLATSDYGTDDSDSDLENDTFARRLQSNNKQTRTKDATPDCIEVPLTTNGTTPIPTIEFVDDENYFVYLQRREPKKRKIKDDDKRSATKKSSAVLQNGRSTSTSGVCTNKVRCNRKNKTDQNSSVVICSDSEDEVFEVSTNSISRTTFPEKHSNDKKYIKNKNAGSSVVTFEILDDDDDNDKPNYMVYLQKEVETNKRKETSSKIDSNEVIICSDSEDEQVTEIFTKENSDSTVKNENSGFEDHPLVYEIESKVTTEEPTIQKIEKDIDAVCPQSFSDGDGDRKTPTGCDSFENSEMAKYNKSDFQEKCENSKVSEEGNFKFANNNHVTICTREKLTVQMGANSLQVDNNFLMFENNIGLPINENLDTNFLIDPSVIFERTTQDHKPLPTGLNEETKIDLSSTEQSSGSNALGDPILSARSNCPQDLDHTQDCRINESLLEEILMDDSYLLEGRKEFEELESFLFNDTTEKQGFYLSNFTLDDCETVSQPETFDADISSLESLLNDSQLFNVSDVRLPNGHTQSNSSNSRSNENLNKTAFKGKNCSQQTVQVCR